LLRALQGKSSMTYLHVTIRKKNSDDWVCIFSDLTVSDLKKKLIKPYRLGKLIYYDGNILPPNDISQIKINETVSMGSDSIDFRQTKNLTKK
jgi:hypothetical protein